MPLAAPSQWACHRPRRVHSTRQVPPWSWPSSGSVERRTSRALHLGTKSGAGLRPPPCAWSSARRSLPPPCGADMDAISTKVIRWVMNHHDHTRRPPKPPKTSRYRRIEPQWLLSVVVVEWLYNSKRIIIIRWADLSDFFFVYFRR